MEAEPLYKCTLKIYESALGKDHPYIMNVLENMAELYEKMGEENEARKVKGRTKEIHSNR